ncbi:MAG: DNA mismatch repair endonuclease MutL [Endomicrobium sp.]|jgi:DNA mismatch repair protein MutL|nr:DNA mismatch repair endonuclease MutL [Endomicrobium sp.]
MSIINILSQETVNKIAAGEVVERPLNVIKELVENSLDAFAVLITIEIETSGKKLIRIYDNGLGMDKKDLELSILRHTTSKIKNFNDLSHIRSLGFRGEALASIAAVSRFEIKTKKKEEAIGWKLSAEGGKDVKVTPWSGSQGTIVEIKDLFFNTPARQKFLKSDSIESARIINFLEEIALANNDIAFKLVSKDKVIFSTFRTDSKIDRISDILGRDFSKTIRNIKIEHPKVFLDVYFTGRDDCLSNKKCQYLFVNSRAVNYPKWLVYCIYQAYKELIPHGKHPGILIYIIIEPSEIDVNMHPTKREVRFINENGIYEIVYKSLKNALASHQCSEICINSQISDKLLSNYTTSYIKAEKHLQPIVYVKEPKSKNYNRSKQTYDVDAYSSVFTKQDEFISRKFNDNIKVLGQVFKTYIIVENRSNLYIFDQHASAERIRYELYLDQAKDQLIKIQQMLMPETFNLPLSLSELLKANISIFNKLGISIEEFGQNSFRITAYPALLGNVTIAHIVKTIIVDISDDKNAEIEQKREKIIRLACKASIRAGDSLSFFEAKKLVNDLCKCKYPFTCPHGRPTAYKISLNELEKFFKRK